VTAAAALLGALFAVGVVTLFVALRPVAPADVPPPKPERASLGRQVENFTIRLALGLGAAVVIGAVTRWPMAALLVGIAGFMAPSMLGGGAARQAKLDCIEGIAGWAEMLRDTMAGSGGLEQSIIATAGIAPRAIRPEVVRLAARLERERLAPALRQFAEDIDDPAGDLVVAALVLAADKSPKRLGDLLGRLAEAARSDVTMRLRIETGRARTRTSVKVITIFTTLFAVFLMLFSSDYLEAYDSMTGQAVLGLVGACFAGSFVWLARAFREDEGERFLRLEAMDA
jgi:tight adherence protein B